jgi:hypothetical protein
MTDQASDNVVRLEPASAALRDQFIGWQCRLRQLAVRQNGGRPSAGMRPRVLSPSGDELSPGIVVLIVPADADASIKLFRHQVLKTLDPVERWEKALEILSSSYFQRPRDFSDVLTALFAGGSALVDRLLAFGACRLEFAQYAQGYRIPCAVTALAEADDLYQATYWHNRLFNPNPPPDAQVLAFAPDWVHATEHRIEE